MENNFHSPTQMDASRQAADLRCLVELARLTTQADSLESLLPQVVEHLRQAFTARLAWITLLTPETDAARVHYASNLPAIEANAYPLEGSPDAAFLATEGIDTRPFSAFASHPALAPLISHLGASSLYLSGAALRAGGQDYGILKLVYDHAPEHDPDRLVTLETAVYLIAGAIRNFCLNQEIIQLTNTDSLTGLYNQSYFLERARQEIQRARRYHHTFSLLMIDIDRFRQINEAHGRQIGDEILRQVANILQSNLRTVDLLARYGGEEFVLLLPETGLNEALGVAGRLLYTLRSTPIATESGKVSITVSVGVSGHTAQTETNIDRLLDRADRALYQSKKNGRDRVTVWVED
jgi:diguanylate cyclase (GGDEF)-like protein